MKNSGHDEADRTPGAGDLKPCSRGLPICLVVLLASGGIAVPARGATFFSWDSSAPGADWTVPGNWIVSGDPDADGVPDADDTIITPTVFGTPDVNVDSTVEAFDYDSASNWDVISNGGVGRTLDIVDHLTKAGSGTLRFRANTAGAGDLHVRIGGDLLLSEGILQVGRHSSDLSRLTVTGDATVAGRLSFWSRSSLQHGTIGGILTLNGNGRVDIVGQGVGVVGSGTVEVGGLSSSVSTTIVNNNQNSTTGHTGTLVLNNSSGVTTYAGQIRNGTGAAPNVLNVVKNNAGTQVFSGNTITYTGDTTINGGRLDINGTSSGQGDYLVNAGGTLGGLGTIGLGSGKSVTVASDGVIAAGDSATVGTLHINNTLNFQDGAIFQYRLSASGADDLLSVEDVTFGANLTLRLNDVGGGGIEMSDEFILMTGSSFGTLPTFNFAHGGGPGIDTSGATVNLVGNDLILSGLETSIIPEQGTGAFIVVGSIVVWLRSRRSLPKEYEYEK